MRTPGADQLALFDLSAPPTEADPPVTPRRSTATAGRTRDNARAEYERLMRRGGFTGNAEALVGRCTTLAVEAGIDYYRHLQNLDNAARYPSAQVAFNERRDTGRRRLTPQTIRRWWDRDTAQAAPLWHSADTLTNLSELRETAASYPWPASIEYVAIRRDRTTGERRAVRERVAGDTARRVYLAVVAHAIETGSVTNAESLRDVGDRAQVTRSPADRGLRALTHLRLLTVASSRGRDTRTTARRYRIVADPDMLRGHLRDNGFTCPIGLSPVVPQMTAGFTASTTSHPAFRSRTGLRHDVWHAVLISDGAATVPQLAADLDRNARTMRRQVAALEAAALVERLDDGTLRARLDHAALDAAAERTGAADRAARQVERHERERDEHERAGMMQAARANGLEIRAEAVTGTPIVVRPDTGETLPLTEWFAQHRHPQKAPTEEQPTGRARQRHLRVVA